MYRYFGEGQKGDMTWKGGNAAIRGHTGIGKDLLLFQTVGKGAVRFLGEFVAAGFDLQQAPDTEGKLRNAIVFNLIPLESVVAKDAVGAATQRDGADSNLDELRRRAIAAAGGDLSAQTPREARQTVYRRSAVVRDYVLARAAGSCEACGKVAPFATPRGTPYLEPHHIRRLSDGGPDDPRYMGAVCPNCHREIHCGAKGDELNGQLQQVVAEKEGTPTDRRE